MRFALALSVLMSFGALAVETPSFDECTQDCPDDDSQGRCSPDCLDCSCCVHVVAIATLLAQRPLPTVLPQRAPVLIVVEPGSPEPDEMLHVPRA